MKKMVKRVATAILATLMAFSLMSCSADETVPKETNIDSLGLMKGTTLTQELDVPGEPFKLVLLYDTGRYDFSNWRITSNKYLNMSATVTGVPEGTVVLVDHMHVDISLQSTKAQLDGMLQDSMDNEYNGTSQDGYYITDQYSYSNKFVIEGYSQTLIEGWGFVNGSYGTQSINEKRLTEKNLVVEGGVYGNKVQAEYKLLIKNEGEEYFHNASVVSEFSIPINVDAYMSSTTEEE